MPDVAPLPERARLFHVGIPKSGTTSLQTAASTSRDALSRHGVLYPGRGRTTASRCSASWADGGDGRTTPCRPAPLGPADGGDRGRSPASGLFGHEFASEADEEMAKRFADAIGPACHVVVTLRSPGAILPSAWQQYVKAGVAIPFDEWLEAVIADPPNRKVTKGFHDRNNQSLVVRRWAGRGRRRPRDRHRARQEAAGAAVRLLRAAARPSDRPARQPEIGGFASNRGLTVPEVELFRGAQPPHPAARCRVGRVRAHRPQRRAAPHHGRPHGGRAQAAAPAWAVERAAELGAAYAKEIADTGVQVIGDLDLLTEEGPRAPYDDAAATQIPISLAAEAMAGMLSAASCGVRSSTSRTPQPPHARRPCARPR